jgi:transcriptional regulator with XRE-family HTH domain
MDTLGEWLNGKLKERGWSQAELARRASISRTSVSDIISGKADAGASVATAIASALGVDEIEVLRRAGITRNVSTPSDRASRLAHRIAQLPEEDQEVLDAMIDGLFLKRGKKSEPTDLPQDGTAKQT